MKILAKMKKNLRLMDTLVDVGQTVRCILLTEALEMAVAETGRLIKL
ncbi:hypothetical protein GCWU000342_01911 [Shuttleworthella satelles DSM 14600]|uniref:Uncharacterized protein n=1 Tax=Shuttleworthella satelles DSM 14600 TaxID=626523 RepID=C4GD66_9FIRM|nr:hypothetical protein GCWU000342_01911 [Shuttleworthia satelles DSM 14600]